ncbi:hypothetical protein KDW40_02240 [Burkholderia cenocepacia]|uniref:hypothetical protein n=1 Tax=Burkholderia cenocepacia TaxID=95486 RepID=UPI001B926DD6|nr:hypothetical protein [Burkholderia cenocepacia]MBR8043385.1 hypothetical protein [Burkholderia cenocepacia]MBR8324550.1 hypothetical protein [Burkholderia cenocepacia]
MTGTSQTQIAATTDWMASPHPSVPGQWMLSRIDENGRTDYVGRHPELLFSGVRAFATKEEAEAHADSLKHSSSKVWTPAAGSMTDTQYVAMRGCRCPSCGDSEGIVGGSIQVDAGTASQPMVCNACGASWADLYTLTGYTDLDAPSQIAA